jgi:sigma-B regulation protein RsbU (phosphoserine phosphatase)
MSPMPSHSNLLQQLMDNMTDNIFFKDRDSKFIMINEADAKWLGFDSPDEAVGKDDFDLFAKEFAKAALEDEQRIIETGKPLLCKEERAEWEDGHAKWVSTTKIPLRNEEGETVGCIGIGRDITDLKRKEFELEEANKKLSEANEQIAEDLRMAANLQKTLLPRTYPSFPDYIGNERIEFNHYYEADIEIGGDFCAVYKVNDTKAGLLICDVMGHGVRAALITGIIRTVAEDLARRTNSPDEFLTAMNRQLFPILRAEGAFLFATACYLMIDVESGVLTGALAGHTVPFLISAKQKDASYFKVEDRLCGPALAISDAYEYESFTTHLEPGDAVMMYTDGICEAVNADQDEFGAKRLLETVQKHAHLPLKSLFENVMQEVRDYCSNEKLGDDICLLGFRLED